MTHGCDIPTVMAWHVRHGYVTIGRWIGQDHNHAGVTTSDGEHMIVLQTDLAF